METIVVTHYVQQDAVGGVNLQSFKVEVDGRVQTVRMSTRAYKTLVKNQKA